MDLSERTKNFNFRVGRLVYPNRPSYYIHYLKNESKLQSSETFPYFLHLRELNQQQRECFTALQKVSNDAKANNFCCATLFAPAGTGKTSLLMQIANNLVQKKIDFLIAGTTGSSTVPFRATTLHQVLGIHNVALSYQQMVDLEISEKVYHTLRKCKLILIEEASMLSLQFLGVLVARIRRIKGVTDGLPLSIVLCGDMWQLGPVRSSRLDSPLTTFKCPITTLGQKVFREAKYRLTLTENIRAKNDAFYAGLLGRLRVGKLTQSDISALKSRVLSNMSEEEQAEGNRAMRLFYTNSDSYSYNLCDCRHEDALV